METKTARWTLGDLATLLNGDLTGPADMPIDRPVAADTNDPRGIAFAGSDKYLDRAENSQVGALLLNREIRETTKPAIRVDDPRTAFFMLLKMSERPLPFTPGIHPSAVIASGTTVDPSASIGAFVVIESDVEIGANVQVFPFSYIGENCKIGAKTIIYPRVTLYRDVVVGEEVILHSGVVVGADGFGFVWDGQRRLKVPQVGTVVMGDNVEIGANTTIDRATVGETSIGKGTKIDNLVQVAHNDVIGEHVVIAGCTAVAGSVRIGDRCVIGGMVGFRDHVELEDDVFVAGMSGIEKNLAGPGQYFGVPALPALEAMRIFKATQRTPELLSRIRDLEKKVGE